MPGLDVDAALAAAATLPQPLAPEVIAFLGSTADRRAVAHIAGAGISQHAIKALEKLPGEEPIQVLVAWAVELSPTSQ
jgi:hypothetical protein